MTFVLRPWSFPSGKRGSPSSSQPVLFAEKIQEPPWGSLLCACPSRLCCLPPTPGWTGALLLPRPGQVPFFPPLRPPECPLCSLCWFTHQPTTPCTVSLSVESCPSQLCRNLLPAESKCPVALSQRGHPAPCAPDPRTALVPARKPCGLGGRRLLPSPSPIASPAVPALLWAMPLVGELEGLSPGRMVFLCALQPGGIPQANRAPTTPGSWPFSPPHAHLPSQRLSFQNTPSSSQPNSDNCQHPCFRVPQPPRP